MSVPSLASHGLQGRPYPYILRAAPAQPHGGLGDLGPDHKHCGTLKVN